MSDITSAHEDEKNSKEGGRFSGIWIDPFQIEGYVRELKMVMNMFDIQDNETSHDDTYAKCNVIEAALYSIIEHLSAILENAGIEI